jgi:F-type H+-transporting ATPase subunit c
MITNKEENSMKTTKLKNFLYAVSAFLFASPAYAQDGDGGMIGIGAGLAVGLAALGAGMGQGKTVAAAMDGIARNPSAQNKMFIPMIIGLVFMETLLIFSWVIAFQLVGKA